MTKAEIRPVARTIGSGPSFGPTVQVIGQAGNVVYQGHEFASALRAARKRGISEADVRSAWRQAEQMQ